MNSLTFAGTGGDGVHYGLLQVANLPSSPVVMTVPVGDEHNVIVAEDLREFLNLGYHNGWFSLELLVYRPDEAVKYFALPDPERWPDEAEILEFLRRELSLQRQPLTLARINELRAKYEGLIVAAAEPDDRERSVTA